MDVLFAPWRYTYIKSLSQEKDHKKCIFCEALRKKDEEALILVRRRHAFIIMNLYPYNTGHVMVVPNRHVSSFSPLSVQELCELSLLVETSLNALNEAFHPHGFNVGINIGRTAGAGIEEHIHIHIVPRWNGDTNFMPVIGGVKVIPQDVRETYKFLRPFFEKSLKIVQQKYQKSCL